MKKRFTQRFRKKYDLIKQSTEYREVLHYSCGSERRESTRVYAYFMDSEGRCAYPAKPKCNNSYALKIGLLKVLGIR